MLKDQSTSHRGIEVMGRHAGWIAAAGGLIEDYDIPVLVLFPEVDFDHDKFIAGQLGHLKCLVAGEHPIQRQ